MQNENEKKSYFAKLTSEETEMLSTGTEVAIWYAVKSYAGNAENTCFASIRRIAKRAKVQNESVLRAIKKFEEVGLIKNLGKKKAENAHWSTYHLKLNMFAGRTVVSDSRTKVFAGTDQSVRFHGIETINGNIKEKEETEFSNKEKTKLWDLAKSLTGKRRFQ